MPKELVIVESPAKARTLSQFLGPSFLIKASLGHVRDLPERLRKGQLGVDVANDFKPDYALLPAKKTVVREIEEAAKGAKTIYLATDPDREGEAISWHLVEAAGLDKLPVPKRRVVFHEITKEAVQQAFRHPRSIDMRLVDAQQARRILDRLVGYQLSPLLWKKIQTGLSAGRVQSVALRMVAERERQIQRFLPREFWSITVELTKHAPPVDGQGPQRFNAELASLKGQKGKLDLPDEDRAEKVLASLEGASYQVAKVTKKRAQRKPPPPFITSTLQQEAWRKLHFGARETMAVAQQLYEGLSLGKEGSTGLITYMRTDSTHVAPSAVAETREYIQKSFGADYLPSSPRVYTRKVKGAQEAHEAIRPTSTNRSPQSVRRSLNSDQFRLYELIWQRMVASQMADALFDTTNVEIEAQSQRSTHVHIFKATGSVQAFPGFLALYTEGKDDAEGVEEDKGPLPSLEQKDPLDCLGLKPEQHFTKPPFRYSEASLVKALEENGIGRPSTYAPIVSTLSGRGYVTKEEGKLKPQEIGFQVDDLLVQNFASIVDLQFTADMEEKLDQIAQGERGWKQFLQEFYEPFSRDLSTAEHAIPDEASQQTCEQCGKPLVVRLSRFGRFLGCTGYPTCRYTRPVSEPKAEEEPSDELCNKCEKPMVLKRGRHGPFLGCTGFPECKNTRPVSEPKAEEEPSDQLCDKCEKPMVLKRGRHGPFLGCTGFPECKNTKPLLKKAGVPCPRCGGDLVERRASRGKVRRRTLFYGCSNYPTCKFSVPGKPLDTPCPECGGVLISRGQTPAACVACGYKGKTLERTEAPSGVEA